MSAGPCEEAQAMVDEVGQLPRGLLYRAAPAMGPPALPRLRERATSGSGSDGLAYLVALGLTRLAGARPALLELAATDPERRLGRALGLLALGDASGTSTITAALGGGALGLRRQAAVALREMRAVRPRKLLYELLDDPDPELRRIAGLALTHHSAKARRTLRALLDDPNPEIRAEIGRALVRTRRRAAPRELVRFPDPWFARLAGARLGDREILAALRARLAADDVEARASARGALTATGQAPAEPRRRPSGGIDLSAGLLEAERGMVALLTGAPTEGGLADLDREAIHAAALVLWAYAGGPSRPGPEALERLGATVERWLVSGLAAEPDAVRLLAALGDLDRGTALRVARARVLGPPGPSLSSSLRTLGRLGDARDRDLLTTTARRLDGARRVEAWLAVLEGCRR